METHNDDHEIIKNEVAQDVRVRMACKAKRVADNFEDAADDEEGFECCNASLPLLLAT